MILKLEDIYYKYKKNAPYILKGISYEFKMGTLYAIMGASGAGKTTLISIIAALDKAEYGKIYYDGVDITVLNEDEFRANKVSIIFQSYNLLYAYTAIDNITTILNICGYRGNYTSKATELLNEVGISKEKHKYLAHDLSGGEQQRVAIARALASNAKVVLADEPTGNLDQTNQENIMSIFKALAHRYNKCIIVVTHSKDVAKYADHILKIKDGKIAQETLDTM